jgi:1,4-dihydroxy-2-naphthoyl-CoA synthase
VIAKVHGIATAAACQLVAACDLAVAADGARFATPGSTRRNQNMPMSSAFPMGRGGFEPPTDGL